MNPFEKANLDRLAEQNDQIRLIRDSLLDNKKEVLAAWAEDAIRLMVRMLFEIHKAELTKIKAELRNDAEIIQGLNLEQIVNDEYKRQGHPAKLRARYDQETQRRFWETLISINRADRESDPWQDIT